MLAVDELGSRAAEYAAVMPGCGLADFVALVGQLLTFHNILDDGRGSIVALGYFVVLGEHVERRLWQLSGAVHDIAMVHLVERAVPGLRVGAALSQPILASDSLGASRREAAAGPEATFLSTFVMRSLEARPLQRRHRRLPERVLHAHAREPRLPLERRHSCLRFGILEVLFVNEGREQERDLLLRIGREKARLHRASEQHRFDPQLVVPGCDLAPAQLVQFDFLSEVIYGFRGLHGLPVGIVLRSSLIVNALLMACQLGVVAGLALALVGPALELRRLSPVERWQLALVFVDGRDVVEALDEGVGAF